MATFSTSSDNSPTFANVRIAVQLRITSQLYIIAPSGALC